MWRRCQRELPGERMRTPAWSNTRPARLELSRSARVQWRDGFMDAHNKIGGGRQPVVGADRSRRGTWPCC
jgi:hypothetical protein